jgi:hypothetical protein
MRYLGKMAIFTYGLFFVKKEKKKLLKLLEYPKYPK